MSIDDVLEYMLFVTSNLGRLFDFVFEKLGQNIQISILGDDKIVRDVELLLGNLIAKISFTFFMRRMNY